MNEGYVLFTIAYLAAAITPGADTMLVLTRALDGRRKAWLVGSGITLAKVTLLLMAFWGAGALIANNPAVLLAAKVFGSGFLAYRAWVLWNLSKAVNPSRRGKAFGDLGIGFATGFTNPQPLAFYLAIVPQVAGSTELGVLTLIVVAGFALVTLVYSALASPISKILQRHGPRLLNRTVALILVGVAAWILLR